MIIADWKAGKFILSFQYNKEDLTRVQRLPVRTWNKTAKHWEVPELAVKSLDKLEINFTPRAKAKKDELNIRLERLVDSKFAQPLASEDHLYPYQRIGTDFLKTAKTALLADEMGLGKTIQSIAAIVELGTESNLVICPNTLKWKWFDEFIKHFNIEPLVIEGSAEERAKKWKSSAKYKIANYDIVPRDWSIMPKKWDAIIPDEAVFIKTHSAQRSKAVKKLQSEYRFALSGLPMERNLIDLHSILQFVQPQVIPSLYYFRERFCILDDWGSIIGYRNLEELHLLTSPFILGRKKKDVLKDLPDKIYTQTRLSSSSEFKEGYSKLKNEFLAWLKETSDSSINKNAEALVKTLRLRQYVEFPDLAGFDIVSPRLQWLEDLYSGIDKLVVFTFFEESVQRIAKHFKTPFVISGKIENKERLNVVNRFNSAEKAILVCTDAARFGLDITGASTAVHFGYLYNPASLRQREDRLHRIGQKNVVNIIMPFFENTIDVGIMRRAEDRQQDIDDFMEGNNAMSLAKLSKTDFRKLVSGE